jgi:hypothetical protein
MGAQVTGRAVHRHPSRRHRKLLVPARSGRPLRRSPPNGTVNPAIAGPRPAQATAATHVPARTLQGPDPRHGPGRPRRPRRGRPGTLTPALPPRSARRTPAIWCHSSARSKSGNRCRCCTPLTLSGGVTSRHASTGHSDRDVTHLTQPSARRCQANSSTAAVRSPAARPRLAIHRLSLPASRNSSPAERYGRAVDVFSHDRLAVSG